MRFGTFIAPFHPVTHDPNVALHRDLELVGWLDQLGYDEAWIGEHHSAGYEIIASPEVFIAAAAERTRTIKLGTGVSSLPYHHPLILADRMVLLDHLTRGRTMFGVGPGALPSDAFMMGIDPVDQRRRMEESLEVMLQLFAGETVSAQTDWFTLRDARLQLLPYTQPCFEIAVAAMISPSGPRLAGKHGLSLLSIGATQTEGFNIMSNTWSIMEERAAEFGTTVDRSDWRLVGPMHIAPTREQARADVQFGLAEWVDYFVRVAALPLVPAGMDDVDDLVDTLTSQGFAVIGTPDDAIEQIERLEKQAAGFGCYLFMAHDWANREATRLSYELFARNVFPHFKGTTQATRGSRDWVAEQRPQQLGRAGEAIMKAIGDHAAEGSASGNALKEAIEQRAAEQQP
ncbi:MAG TPA: LLM class flavin-dependent oxidoreductase [Actinomycetota bacterium]|jgi:limonene 1,2-monooxygenase|nr:LLM class flavin-dependent oxidoreductase [Actinomycetota bacterium]